MYMTTFTYWSNVTQSPVCFSRAEFAKEIEIDKIYTFILSFYHVFVFCTFPPHTCALFHIWIISSDIVQLFSILHVIMKDFYDFFYRMETRIIRINNEWNPWKRKKGQCSSDIR